MTDKVTDVLIRKDPIADRIMEHVRKEKATTFSEIARATELSIYTISDYVRLMGEEGYVEVRDKGSFKLVFLTKKGQDFLSS